MNFLQLCQDVARESRVISGTLPLAVTGQTGKLLKIVYWVNNAWLDIQNLRPDWFWMRAEYTAPATASGGTGLYTAAASGITERFSHWARDGYLTDGTLYRPHTIYAEATGVADEGPIEEIPWESYRMIYRRGAQTENRPSRYSISPAGEFAFGPIPNGAYIRKGEYFKSAQTLAANTDTPECPAQFHRVIVFRALEMLAEHDEAPREVGELAHIHYDEILAALERQQLPEVTFGGNPIGG